MKCEDLQRVIADFSALCDATHSTETAERTTPLIAILKTSHSKTVAWLVEKLNSATPANGSGLGEAGLFLRNLDNALRSVAKPQISKDLKAFSEAIIRHANSDPVLLAESITQTSRSRKNNKAVSEIRPEIVSQLTRQLEEALGDELGFPTVFAQLEERKDLRPKEMAAIAKQFAGATVSGRAAALKKIFGRHQALMISRAKSAATGGRIAG